MTTYTVSPDCISHLNFKEKIMELEIQVTNLYQIREDETFLDTILEAAVVNSTITDKPLSPPEPWPALGAKPKKWQRTEPWIKVQENRLSKRNRYSSSIPLVLRNSFESLGTLKAKRHRSIDTEHEGPVPPMRQDGASTPTRPAQLRQGEVHFTPKPTRTSPASHSLLTRREANVASVSSEATRDIADRATSTEGSSLTANPNNTDKRGGGLKSDVGNARTIPQTDIILIGDAMTKHVKLAKADNICLSNTSVEDLSSVIPEILKDKPNHTKIVIHTGSFDILHKKTGTETFHQATEYTNRTSGCIHQWTNCLLS